MKEREITALRKTANAKLEGLTETTTIKELYEKVKIIADHLKEKDPDALPDKTPTAKFLAQNVKPIHISKDRSTVIFENGYAYYCNESSEAVVTLESCCHGLVDDADFNNYMDPRKTDRAEREASTISAEMMQGLSWQLAIMLLGDLKSRYNNSHRKGDRCRTDNVVMTDEGEELDLFDSYYDDRSYYGIDDEVVDRLEAARLRDVAFDGFTDKQVEIMDGVLAGRRHDDIAADLGVARGTVSKIVMRKRAKAQEALRAEMDKDR